MNIDPVVKENLSIVGEFRDALRDLVIETEDFEARQRSRSDLDGIDHKIGLTWESAQAPEAQNPRGDFSMLLLARERSKALIRESRRLARRYDLWTEGIQDYRRY